jgi:hypothetical protein
MNNVRSALRAASRYVLEIDRASLDKLRAKTTGAKQINVESIPEPFIGNPEALKVQK